VQKTHFKAAGVQQGDFAGVANAAELAAVAADFGFPLMVKSRKLAYDGKGNAVGPGRYCSPRHKMPFDSIVEGSTCVG